MSFCTKIALFLLKAGIFLPALTGCNRKANAYNYRGLAYYEKGDYDRAISDYTEIIRLDPNDAEAYFFRGLVYDNKGDHERAIADYESALRIDPNNADARKALEEIRSIKRQNPDTSDEKDFPAFY